jgi:hypothetical protein
MRSMGLPDASQLDLTRETEANRDAIYRLAVAHFWLPDDEGKVPAYSPAEAKLTVFFMYQRWFATFLELEDLDQDDLPEAEKRYLSRVILDSRSPYGVAFSRC